MADRTTPRSPELQRYIFYCWDRRARGWGGPLLLSLAVLAGGTAVELGQSPASVQVKAAGLHDRDSPRTESALRAKLRGEPFDAATARSLAALLEQTGRVNAAVELRRTVLAHSAGAAALPVAEMELATALVEAGRSNEALPILQSLVAAKPFDEPAVFELGTAFARSEDFKSAASAFAKAVQLKPTDAEAQRSAAKALVTLLLYADAEPYLEAAVRLDGASAEMRALRGMIYSHTGREELAIAEFQASIALDASNVDAQLQLGEALLERRQFQQAIPPLRQALAIHPSVPAYFHLSKAYRGLGEVGKANEAIQLLEALRAREAADTKVDVLRRQGDQALAERRASQAAEAYETALALRPEDGDLVYHLALARGQAGEYDRELGLLQKALTLVPRSAGALSELGTLEGMRGERALAEKTLRQALQIDPQRADALSNLAVLVAQRGDLSGAEALLTDAIESSPAYASAYRNLGLVYAAQGRSSEAETALRKSVLLDPNDASSEVALGQFYLGNQKNLEALGALRAAARLAPTNREVIALIDELCSRSHLDQPTTSLCAVRSAEMR